MKSTSALLLILFCGGLLQAQTTSILVDFGSANNPSPAPWNNLTNPRTGVLTNMTDVFGQVTEVDLMVTDSFTSANSNGTLMPDPTLGIPSSASGDSFYGNPVEFSGSIQPTGGIRLSSLDTSLVYQLKLFASRVANDNRQTEYIVSGATVDTGYLNVASNQDSILQFSVHPSDSGTVDIQVSTGPENTNAFGFFYLGALILEYPDIPPDPLLEWVYPTGGEFWQIGKTVELVWKTTVPDSSLLEYSIDDGNTWSILDSLPPLQNTYEWEVEGPPSEMCLFRITADSLSDMTQASLEISDNTDTCTIVVIGSSTAAGTGASVADSAWVNRYTTYTYQRDTRFNVINLARGGYRTYHLLPTGDTLSAGVGIEIDTTRNITKALSFNPSAVIINLPSNDAASSFPPEDQMRNFRIMESAAAANGVRTYVCTTQPRNFGNPAQIEIQTATRDSILAYFGSNAIDFWTDLADSEGKIRPEVNSGDGVHVNDLGHGFLFQRVVDKALTDSLCVQVVIVGTTTLEGHFMDPQISIYPNPFHQELQINLSHIGSSQIRCTLFDLYGRQMDQMEASLNGQGGESFTFSPRLEYLSNPSMYYLQVEVFDEDRVIRQVFPVVRR